MLSPDTRVFSKLAAVAFLTLGLAGCFRPLYGPTASGASLQSELAAIEIPENQFPEDRGVAEHYVRSELIFNLNGSGIPQPKKYRLALNYSQGLTTPIVDSATGRALSATLTGTLRYTLTTLDGSLAIASGQATAAATYDRFAQRFSSVRAARDAEIRVSKDLAEQVKTQLAAALATRP
jgi:LPS-assembly lipoprotein